MPAFNYLRRLNMPLTFPDLFLLLLLILPNYLWKCRAGELILDENLHFDHDAIEQQSFDHADHRSRVRRSSATSNQSNEDELCPECVIKREVLDHLPPSIYPPRDKSGGPMRLSTKIVVKELMDMSVKTETLTVMAWIRMYWINLDIRWDVKRLKVKEIRVNPSQVWVPDMVISNSLSSFEIMGSSTLPLIVGFTGFTYYSVPVIIKTKCQATVTYFPFDEQLCEINFLSWTYHSKMVNLTLSSFTTNLEGHIGNIEWTITNITSQIVYEHDVTNHPLYIGEVIRYPYIKYRIHLSRKPDFYVNSLITPSLLLSWLGSIIFLLPSDCGEKLGFSVTLFL
ncbi:neuronal acetylcholine receptor subunit alpha-9-I-like, partial [Convolutriloba macropyga]|uniref:neuronal acetylcholine receptor subunit alpha-9-I-like n=1 Tax=Convolutriloba macropyga TaxID=536237 RepID=UPI003F51C6EE